MGMVEKIDSEFSGRSLRIRVEVRPSVPNHCRLRGPRLSEILRDSSRFFESPRPVQAAPCAVTLACGAVGLRPTPGSPGSEAEPGGRGWRGRRVPPGDSEPPGQPGVGQNRFGRCAPRGAPARAWTPPLRRRARRASAAFGRRAVSPAPDSDGGGVLLARREEGRQALSLSLVGRPYSVATPMLVYRASRGLPPARVGCVEGRCGGSASALLQVPPRFFKAD